MSTKEGKHNIKLLWNWLKILIVHIQDTYYATKQGCMKDNQLHHGWADQVHAYPYENVLIHLPHMISNKVNGSSVNHCLRLCLKKEISPEEGDIKSLRKLSNSSYVLLAPLFASAGEQFSAMLILSNIINLTTPAIWISAVAPSHAIHATAAMLISLCLISK